MEENNYWSFNVKFEKNEWNWKTFEDFKSYAKENTDNNYLAAIRQLLLTNKLLKIVVENEQRNERIKKENRKQD